MTTVPHTHSGQGPISAPHGLRRNPARLRTVGDPDVEAIIAGNGPRDSTIESSEDADSFHAETLAAYLPAAAYVFEVSSTGKFSFPFVSAACADIYGFNARDAMADASRMHGAIHPEDQDSFARAGQRSAKQLCPMHWEGRIKRPNGEVRNVSISSRPRRLPNGAVQFHGVVIDRTSAHERDVLQQLELTRRNQHQGDLIAMASHDIGAPLASVLGFAEQALSVLEDEHTGRATDPNQNADLRMFLNRIIKNGRRIDELRRDLLVSQAWESGRLNVTPDSVLVRSRIMAAVESVPGGPEIRISCPPRLRCYAQASHVDQMLTNLLTNAGRFATTEITVRAQTTGATTAIAVLDDGPGVPEEFVSSLFERFAHVDVNRGGGTGLGLFITHKLATANSGTVRYAPAPSGGACFTVELPTAQG